MNPSQIYVLISIVVLLVIAILLFFVKKNKRQKKLTPLTGLAFAFILAGIIFGNNRLTGYTLMGIGIFLAIIDMIKKLRRKRK